MGLLDFLKKPPTHEKKLDLAYKCYKPEMVGVIFPQGIHQANCIIISIAKICHLQLETCTAKDYHDILSVYSDVKIRCVLTHSDEDIIITHLIINHNEHIRNEATAIRVFAYCKSNISDPRFALDNRENWILFQKSCNEMYFKHSGNKCADFQDSTSLNEEDKQSENDTSPKHYCFENLSEFAMYTQLYKSETNVVWDSSDIYIKTFNEAYHLVEQRQHSQAIDILNECLKVNPIGLSARFELVECYIFTKQYSAATDILCGMKDYLYNNSQKAKLYRRLGFIAIEKASYEEAKACYKYSLYFEDHPSVLQEMRYIDAKAGDVANNISAEIILIEHNIPLL